MTSESEGNREHVEAQKRRKRVLQRGGGNFQQRQMLLRAQDEERKCPPHLVALGSWVTLRAVSGCDGNRQN